MTPELTPEFSKTARDIQSALRRDPGNAQLMTNYGNLLLEAGRPTQAILYFRAALAADPSLAEVYTNLGNVFRKQGKVEQAIEYYRRTLRRKPHAMPAHSNLLLACNSQMRVEEGLLEEHLDWARRHAANLECDWESHGYDWSADRRLRIGYVSPDFRRHSVAYFIQPILQSHDRNRFEIYCYSNVARPDRTTDSLRAAADHWRDIWNLSDEQAVTAIREDRIDILVDLAGHMGIHRLLVFARRAAPVQVTYLGYPNTTGLATMDYRLTDSEADPPGLTESHYVEKLIRLPDCFLCYSPPSDSPEPRSFDEQPDRVTFGCFNNFAKVTGELIGDWAQILRAVPISTLLLKSEGFADEQTVFDLRDEFSRRGVEGSRIECEPRGVSLQEHLNFYHRVDIALDTFPYHGATTTCEALWMGVPVVTRAGKAHVSRVGASLLGSLGLSELVAESGLQYRQIATALASDIGRLKGIARDLRQRMVRSPLMNGPEFVAGLETAFLEIWRKRREMNAAGKYP